MSQALDLLREIRAQNARIIELLERQTGAQLQSSGVTYDGDGTPFLPGSGRLGGAGAYDDERDLTPATTDPAERARILAEMRARHPKAEPTENE